jgi:Fic family protein
MNQEEQRHSRPFEVELITDPDEIAAREARNALRQFDAVVERIEYWLQPDRPFKLRPSHIQELNRIALEGISALAGVYRPAGIGIKGSTHKPVGAHLVPGLVEEMCDYVNEHWARSALHLAAYVMWRLNWIHPFTDGNGRTSRAVSYLVLCVRLGERVPGTRTVPDQIASDKKPYYTALEAADEAWKRDQLDLTEMEQLLSALLATQLLSVLEAATQDARDREAPPTAPT